MKELISVPLNELRTSDVEGLGQEVERNGVVYRWVKNKGTTGLLGSACCLRALVVTEAEINNKVFSPDAPPSTSVVSIYSPAGSPLTAIGPSGSNTGDHGWIAVKGFKKVYLMPPAAANVVGAISVATCSYPATHAWAANVAAYSDAPAKVFKAVVYEVMTSDTPATAVLALAYLDCQ